MESNAHLQHRNQILPCQHFRCSVGSGVVQTTNWQTLCCFVTQQALRLWKLNICLPPHCSLILSVFNSKPQDFQALWLQCAVSFPVPVTRQWPGKRDFELSLIQGISSPTPLSITVKCLTAIFSPFISLMQMHTCWGSWDYPVSICGRKGKKKKKSLVPRKTWISFWAHTGQRVKNKYCVCTWLRGKESRGGNGRGRANSTCAFWRWFSAAGIFLFTGISKYLCNLTLNHSNRSKSPLLWIIFLPQLRLVLKDLHCIVMP